MKWLPVIRYGSAAWILPLSIPAAEVLAAILVQWRSNDFSQMPAAQSLAAKSLADEQCNQPLLQRLIQVLRQDQALLCFAILECSQASSEQSSSEHWGLSIEQVADYLASHCRSIFRDHDRWLATEQIARRLGPTKCLDRWNGGCPSASDCPCPAAHDRGEAVELFNHETMIQCLRRGGPQVPDDWVAQWPAFVADADEELADTTDIDAGNEAESAKANVGTASDRLIGSYGRAVIDLMALARTVQERQWLSQRFDDRLQVAKLAALRQLAYGLSHEINNPLAAIRTRAEMLQRESNGLRGPQFETHLRRIVDATMRAHEMIADMMYFARPPQVEFGVVDAVALTAEVVDEFRERGAKSAIAVNFFCVRGTIQCEADQRQLRGALRAILTNAFEAIGHDGAIGVELRRVGRWLRWKVCDSGPGISEEGRKHAFDPYYSGREAGRGLGLGLSRVYRVARSHGGGASIGDAAGGCAVGCQVRMWIRRRKVQGDGKAS